MLGAMRGAATVWRILLAGLFLALAPGFPPARAGERPLLAVPRAAGPVRVDGRLDEEAWRHALAIPLRYEAWPGENLPADVETTCLVTWDEHHLYVAFRAEDDPREVRAHLSDRDRAFRDDQVGFVVDPFDDARRGFAFLVNPLGVQSDCVVTDSGAGGFRGNLTGAPGEDWSWDAIWDAAARVGPGGWTAEIAVPLDSLRFPRTEGVQTWGFTCFRSRPRTVRRSYYPVPIDRDRSCWLCQVPRITGMTGIRPGRDVEVDPTLTWGRSEARDPFPAGGFVTTAEETDLGLSARWGVTPNVSLDLALNPDFSQVEADAVVLDVNRTFTIFYPEKRPFFLEGADFFRTPYRAVHTRQVVDPSVGIKLTGKEGRNAGGVYLVRDRVTHLVFPASQWSTSTSLDRENTAAVLRWRRDVGETSTLGVLLTDREGEDGYLNRVYGVDGTLRLDATNALIFQFLRSDTRYPGDVAEGYDQPEGLFHGRALSVNVNHRDKTWDLWMGWGRRSRGFRADAGFIPRVDTRELGGHAAYTLWGEGNDWFTSIRVQANVHRTRDGARNLLGEGGSLDLRITGPWQSTLVVSRTRNRQAWQGTVHELSGWHGWVNVRPTGDFTCSVGFSSGDAIDYAGNRAGDRWRVAPGLTWNVGRHLYVQLDLAREALRVPGGTLYRADVHQGRFVWFFDVRTFVRAIVQWTDVQRNRGFYPYEVDSRSRRLFTQLLFSYKVNPRTVFYAGTTDTRLGDERVDLLAAARTYFVKLGYAWRL